MLRPDSGCNSFILIGSETNSQFATPTPPSPSLAHREDAKKLLESIPCGGDLAGLRDRALISTMLFSFARISAVLSLKRQDFYYQGPRRWLRFHEKGGKEHEIRHTTRPEETIDEYLARVSIDDKQPLYFRA
jgi:integrase